MPFQSPPLSSHPQRSSFTRADHFSSDFTQEMGETGRELPQASPHPNPRVAHLPASAPQYPAFSSIRVDELSVLSLSEASSTPAY